MSTQIDHAKPKARKPHCCDLCARTIDAGETYDRYRMVGDDGPYVWKQCGHCTALLRLHGDEIIWDRHEGYYDEDIRSWEPVEEAEKVLQAHWLDGWRDDSGTLHDLPPTPTPRSPSEAAGTEPSETEEN